MCLLILLGCLIVLLLALLVKSAQVLLPWTITAAVLAVLSGLGLGKVAGALESLGCGDQRGEQASFDHCLGYLACWLVICCQCVMDGQVAPDQARGCAPWYPP